MLLGGLDMDLASAIGRASELLWEGCVFSHCIIRDGAYYFVMRPTDGEYLPFTQYPFVMVDELTVRYYPFLSEVYLETDFDDWIAINQN